MSTTAERMIEDLHKVISEIDELVREAATEAGDGKVGRIPALRGALANARARVTDLKDTMGKDVKTRAQTANRYVRENAWVSIGTAAAAAFIAGLLIGRPR